jgi:hypothetical protein
LGVSERSGHFAIKWLDGRELRDKGIYPTPTDPPPPVEDSTRREDRARSFGSCCGAAAATAVKPLGAPQGFAVVIERVLAVRVVVVRAKPQAA